MEIHATLNWIDKLQFVGRGDKGPAVVFDNLEGAGGPTPMQMVLMGVAGCTGMDVISILKKKRADVRYFRIEISGTQAEDHPHRFTHVRINYVVTGTGIDPNAVERSIELSTTKYCSATASINAELSHTYEIIEDSGQ